MLCTLSISMNCGSGIRTSRNRPTVSCNFARRFVSASISTSGVGATSRPNAMAISGSHGRRSGARVGHLVAEALLDDVVGIVASEVHVLAQQLAPDRIWRRRGVRLADRVLVAHPGRFLAQRIEEARLADARFADDLDQASRARARRGERLAHRRELGRAADQRQLLQRFLSRPRTLGAAERPRLNRLRLALDRERRELGRLEQRVRVVEHVGRRVDRGPARPWPSGARRDSPHRPSPYTCGDTPARCRRRTPTRD